MNNKIRNTSLGVILTAALALPVAACTGDDTSTPPVQPDKVSKEAQKDVEKQAENFEDTPKEAPKQEAPKKVEPKPEPKKAAPPQESVSQQSAVQAGQDYIDMMGFSKAGLIEQLSSEYGDGFSKADATYAANHVSVNWNSEAVESAETYMEMGGFSRSSLIDQLTSPYGDQFTQAQAEYAVNQVGL